MLKIWGRTTSARTQKVLLAAAELGLEHVLIPASATMGPDGHVSKGGASFGVVDTDAYRAMNPNGTVPTIDDDGFVLWESNAIVQYLGMRYAPEAFYGADPRIFGSASRWMLWENEKLIPPMHALVKHSIRLAPDQRDPAEVRAAVAALNDAFTVVDAQLARTRFIAADQWSMGDIPMTIRVHRFMLLAVPGSRFENIARYYAEIRERRSFAAIADPAMHLSG